MTDLAAICTAIEDDPALVALAAVGADNQIAAAIAPKWPGVSADTVSAALAPTRPNGKVVA